MADPEVFAVADVEQVGHVGGDAVAVAAVARPGADAGGFGQVVVAHVVEAGVAAGVVEGALERLPGVDLRALDRDGTVGAVEVAALGVIFELAVPGQDGLEIPVVTAERDPGGKVVGHAAQGDGAVDGGGAAHHLAAVQADLAAGAGVGVEAPVVVAPGDPGLEQVAGHLGHGAVVGPGLDQQDASVGVLGEAGCDHCAGRAGSDHNVVIRHDGTPRCGSWLARSSVRRGAIGAVVGVPGLFSRAPAVGPVSIWWGWSGVVGVVRSSMWPTAVSASTRWRGTAGALRLTRS